MSPEVFRLGLTVTAFGLAWVLAEQVRRNAERLSLVQVPNARSSHSVPTPSGGGIAIAIAATLVGLFYATTDPRLWLILLTGAAAALLGFMDDRLDLPSSLRLAVHALLTAILLWAIGDLPSLATPLGPLHPILLYCLLSVAGIWWINLFNFMDGIDGIASSQAIFMVVALIALTLSDGVPTAGALIWWMSAVGSASIGFLILNWPPARIFMGDAGSNFVAFSIFAGAISLIAQGEIGYAIPVILGALFITDATVTLLRRITSGQRWFSAHRSHAYQRLSQRWQRHLPVTLLSIGINVLWLAPLAYVAQSFPELAWPVAVIAYVPLTAISVMSGAGKSLAN